MPIYKPIYVLWAKLKEHKVEIAKIELDISGGGVGYSYFDFNIELFRLSLLLKNCNLLFSSKFDRTICGHLFYHCAVPCRAKIHFNTTTVTIFKTNNFWFLLMQILVFVPKLCRILPQCYDFISFKMKIKLQIMRFKITNTVICWPI